MVRTVLALNAGSSSVKASLLHPHPSSFPVKNEGGNQSESSTPATSTTPPARLVTAHAERLQTPSAVLHVSISVAAVDEALSSNSSHATTDLTTELLSRPEKFKRTLSHSLHLPARSTSFHFEADDDDDNGEKNGDNKTHTKKKNIKIEKEKMTHQEAIQCIFDALHDYNPSLVESIVSVGHRVVHGGTKFTDSAIIDESVLDAIESVSHLAPLHNPANICGIKATLSALPNTVSNVAVFDTSYHCATMPPVAYTYPLPPEYRTDLQIRKYGFHGTSVRYVVRRATEILNNHRNTAPADGWKMIVAHLGNGASLTAVVDGKSVDTTMGFTPLAGLMMGTRSGSVDPSIVPFAAKNLKKSADDVLTDLNKRSGLKGIGNGDNDMRSILQRESEGDPDAELAAGMFVYILAQHIASMMVACGGCIDALVFTAGIGENSSEIRKRTVEKLGPMLGHVELDTERNEKAGKDSDGIISVRDSTPGMNKAPVVLVVPTDEEAMICDECVRLVKEKHD